MSTGCVRHPHHRGAAGGGCTGWNGSKAGGAAGSQRVVRRARLQAPGPVVQAVVHIRREPRTGGLAQPPAPPWSAGWACRTLHRVRVRQNGRLAPGGAGLTGPSVARTVDRPRFSAAVVVCPRRSGPLVSGSVRGRPVAADFPLGPCRSAATGAAIDPPEHPREQAHLPAEQPAPGQDARLPAPHADPRGSRDPGRSSAQGPGESVRLRSGRPASTSADRTPDQGTGPCCPRRTGCGGAPTSRRRFVGAAGSVGAPWWCTCWARRRRGRPQPGRSRQGRSAWW
jgi:hypothetical protein